MPENPLLPNAKLQALYTDMVRLRALAADGKARVEAILATLTGQLESGDAVVSGDDVPVPSELFQPGKRRATRPQVLSAANPLSFAAGLATASQLADNLAGNSRLVVAIVDNRKLEASWSSVLDQAQRARLPMIIVCIEAVNTRAQAGAVEWPALIRSLRAGKLPILSVDGADAVAMYRAMQESVLRARHNDGPALLWCVMPKRRSGARGTSASSTERLEAYMSARNIPLSPGSARSRR